MATSWISSHLQYDYGDKYAASIYQNQIEIIPGALRTKPGTTLTVVFLLTLLPLNILKL